MPDLPTPSEAAERARRETVEAWFRAHPDWTLAQFAEAWGYSTSGVHKAFHSAGIVYSGGWQKGSE